MMQNIIVKIIKSMQMYLTANHPFDDGSFIRPSGRDFYIYQKPDGHSVVAYVFMTGSNEKFDWVIVKESINKWSEPNCNEEIFEAEQREIIEKLASYKKIKNDRIGLEDEPLGEVQDVHEWLSKQSKSNAKSKGLGSN